MTSVERGGKCILSPSNCNDHQRITPTPSYASYVAAYKRMHRYYQRGTRGQCFGNQGIHWFYYILDVLGPNIMLLLESIPGDHHQTNQPTPSSKLCGSSSRHWRYVGYRGPKAS